VLKLKQIEFVPRSSTVTKCELDGVTTIRRCPESQQADVYRQLARNVIGNKNAYIPKPMKQKSWLIGHNIGLPTCLRKKKLNMRVYKVVVGIESNIYYLLNRTKYPAHKFFLNFLKFFII
jgi:hypothetical protein